MKKTLILLILFISFNAYSQQSINNLKIRNKLTVVNEIELDDSSVIAITTGDTLATKEWTIQNAAILTGNNTEIFFNSGGILGSSPLFTYNPLDSTLVVDSLQLVGGERISWNTSENTINIPTGLGSIIQAGQEIQIKVYNNTGSPISNGTAVYPNGTFNDFPTIGLAQSNTHNTIGVDYGLTTTSVDNGNYGFVVWFGKAHDLNTNSYDLGDTIWISSTNAGEITNVKPMFPNFAIQIGIVMKKDASDGIIFVTSRSNIDDIFHNFWNGTIKENFDFFVTATGGVITGTLSPTNGHPDLTLIFSDGFTIFDTSPSATITLTAGTNSNPQMNYIYIPKSTKLLTISTSGFPTIEHKAIAKILLKSADFVEKYKATINQNINDPIANTTTSQGQLSAITKRIRLDHAKHISGTEGTSTIVTGPTPDDVWVAVTEGKISQLNEHTFPVFDTQTGDSLYVSNHFVNPDTLIGNLNELLNDALGNSLNNTSFSFVCWGVMNKTSEPSHVKINLPTRSYAFASPQNAVSDALNYSVYSIPSEYVGVGFLIARFTYTYKNDDWVLIDTEDLTGFTPNTSAGGGAGGTGVTTFLGLTDTESSYTPYEFQIANAGGTALESPSGITFDNDTLSVDGFIGIGTSNPLSALHLNKGFGVGSGISWGDGDTEIYESSDDFLKIRTTGIDRWRFQATVFGSASGSGPAMIEMAPTATATVFRPRFSDNNTGFGSNAVDQVSIIAGGKEIARASENVTEQFIINPQGDLTGTLSNPNWAFGDGDTGGTEFTDDELSLIANSIEAMRLTEDTVFVDSVLKVNDIVIVGTDIVEINSALYLNDALNNVFIGDFSGVDITTGQHNSTLGIQTGTALTEGDANVIIGAFAGDALTEGDDNIIIGVGSGTSLLSGNNNVFIGRGAGGGVSTGVDNIHIGYNSGILATGDRNTTLGTSSGEDITGNNNTFFGYQAGLQVTGGGANTFLGMGSGTSNLTGTGNIYLGYLSGSSETGSNKLFIDNSSTATPLLYGEFDNDIVKINGTQIESTGTIADNDATPDVSASNVWTYNGTSNAVTVTDLDNPDVGAIYRIIGNSDTHTITINDGGNFNLSANFVGGIDDVITIFVQADNDYIEISRSDN